MIFGGAVNFDAVNNTCLGYYNAMIGIYREGASTYEKVIYPG